jgi:hypothetical protein
MRKPLSIALTLVLLGCGGGSSDDTGTPKPDAFADTSDSGTDDAIGFDLDGAPSDSGSLGCSADLRSVVDATGKVITTCPADQGCSGGVCKDACVAAADSRGNVGCDFRVTTAPTYPAVKDPCFAVFLANTWPKPAKIAVTRDAATYDVTVFARIPENGKPASAWKPVPSDGIPVDEVAVLFMSGDPDAIFTETGVSMKCPVATATGASSVLPGSGRGAAFHITSSVPISGYDILPYGGAESHFPSAELLYPTSAWGKNYLVTTAPPGTYSAPGPEWVHILASEDDTTVKVLPTVDLPAGTGGVFAAAPKGKTATFALAAGQYLQWQLPTGTSDPSGTVVLADKPVAVFAGNRFFRLQPTPAPGGESTHQQIPHIGALSSDYVASPYATRRKDLAEESIHYRLVGAFDGTTLTFDPAITGAPPGLAQGEIADFVATGPFRVSSQDASHPFLAAQIMDTANVAGGSRPGATAPGYGTWLGDEEFVVMLPPAQFLSRYVFFTDPAYPTTNLVLTRVKSAKGFADVKIDCLGVVSGWKAVGASGMFEVTNVDLVRAGVGVGTCLNGRHTADSVAPFGVVVWGLDAYSSYAYPAGGNAATLSTVTVSPVPK